MQVGSLEWSQYYFTIWKVPGSLRINTKSTACAVQMEQSLDDNTPIYDMIYPNILSPVLRPIAQKKRIPFKIWLFVDNGPGHLRVLMETEAIHSFHAC